jgi:hypothetical protein
LQQAREQQKNKMTSNIKKPAMEIQEDVAQA